MSTSDEPPVDNGELVLLQLPPESGLENLEQTNGATDGNSEPGSTEFDNGSTPEEIEAAARAGLNDKFKSHIHYIMVSLVYLMGLIFVLGVCLWAFHLFTPFEYHWLKDPQQEKLQTLLTGGLVGAVVGYVKDRT